jgi:hypothetical protein
MVSSDQVNVMENGRFPTLFPACPSKFVLDKVCPVAPVLGTRGASVIVCTSFCF